MWKARSTSLAESLGVDQTIWNANSSIHFEVGFDFIYDSRPARRRCIQLYRRPAKLSQQCLQFCHYVWPAVDTSPQKQTGHWEIGVQGLECSNRLLSRSQYIHIGHAVVPATRRTLWRRCQFLVCHLLRRWTWHVRTPIPHLVNTSEKNIY